MAKVLRGAGETSMALEQVARSLCEQASPRGSDGDRVRRRRIAAGQGGGRPWTVGRC